MVKTYGEIYREVKSILQPEEGELFGRTGILLMNPGAVP